MLKYISILIFAIQASTCFSQKVLVIKSPVPGLIGDTIFARDVTYDSLGNFGRINAYGANKDGDYIITSDRDSIFLIPIDFGYRWLSVRQYHQYPEFQVRHIWSYPGDTIVISGLSFLEYPYEQVTRGYYLWRTREQALYHRIPVINKNWPYRLLLHSIPYPHVQIAATYAGHRLTLRRVVHKVFTQETIAGTNRSFYNYYSKQVYFTFVVDLSGISP